VSACLSARERVSVGEGASEWLTAIERVIYFTL
jgi:hypothetical protein